MIALVALPDLGAWRLTDLASALAAAVGGEGEVDCLDDPPHARLRIAGEELLAVPQPHPISWDLIDRACAAAWYWPEAAEILAGHACHAQLVVRRSSGKLMAKALLLTRAAASIGESFGYLGVYWDGSTMVHSAAAFSASARAMRPGELPLRLWIDFRLAGGEEDGPCSLFTRGLDALGLREIEVVDSKAPRDEILAWAYNTAHYLLAQGAVIEDGQTVAINRQQWIHVYLRTSQLDPSREVYLLDIGRDAVSPGSL